MSRYLATVQVEYDDSEEGVNWVTQTHSSKDEALSWLRETMEIAEEDDPKNVTGYVCKILHIAKESSDINLNTD